MTKINDTPKKMMFLAMKISQGFIPFEKKELIADPKEHRFFYTMSKFNKFSSNNGGIFK